MIYLRFTATSNQQPTRRLKSITSTVRCGKCTYTEPFADSTAKGWLNINQGQCGKRKSLLKTTLFSPSTYGSIRFLGTHINGGLNSIYTVKNETNPLAPLINKINSRHEKISQVTRKRNGRGGPIAGDNKWVHPRLPLSVKSTIISTVTSSAYPLISKEKKWPTLFIQSTRNNTLFTLTDSLGKVVKGGWASAGSVGFKNSRKSTAQASQAAAKSITSKARAQKIRSVILRVSGVGRAKAAVVRAFRNCPLKVLAIDECTPVVHNGCRSPKKRRI